MKKRNSKHEKRIKKLIISCALCAIILAISTYAWFIGMKTVNLSSFDVNVSAIDSLYLSLDGETWKDTIDISETTYNPEKYTGNTNSWGGSGLIPMSSVGKIDPAVSRLVLYEKGSLTASPGGYRIMASRAKNQGDKEADGYVAFDLFIKNMSGKEYYADYNKLNEEAIYLTPQSTVKVSDTGADAEKTGIENSVRVGFAQIGRVKADAAADTIRGIKCDSTGAEVTKICDQREAQIWEPNDTKHVQNAINWYNTSCKKRIGEDITSDASYQGTCKTVADGTAYKTYAIGGTINYTDKVDVYDGEDFNGYTTSIGTTPGDGKLYSYDYFTDTKKNIAGTARPEFISLAPNSVTKVRVYIWIEGQDIDNYDFASLGKKISVEFGFTKEQLYGDDIDYEGKPDLPESVNKHPNKPATSPEPEETP